MDEMTKIQPQTEHRKVQMIQRTSYSQKKNAGFGRRGHVFLGALGHLPLLRPNPFGEKKDMVRWTEECHGVIPWSSGLQLPISRWMGLGWSQFGNLFSFSIGYI